MPLWGRVGCTLLVRASALSWPGVHGRPHRETLRGPRLALDPAPDPPAPYGGPELSL